MGFVRSFRRQMKQREMAAKKRSRKMLLEPLEPRILLSSDPLSYTAAAGAAVDLTLRLQDVEGIDTLQLINNNAPPETEVVVSQALAETSEVQITGADQDDKLTIDLDFEALFDAIPITFSDVSANDSDTLKVVSGGDLTWNVTGADSGIVATINFSGIENLSGAADNEDTFIFQESGGLSGSIDGGAAGSDTLDYSAYTTDVTVNLSSPDAPPGTTGVSNIENIVGGSGDDSLTGDENANILAGGAGTNTLTGGAGDDTYVLMPGSTNTISDIGGSDTLDYSAFTESVTVDLITNAAPGTTDTSRIEYIENVIGGAGDDTLTGDENANRLAGGLGDDTLAGGLEDDTYVITPDGGAETIIEEDGAGDDTILGSDVDTDWIIDGVNSGWVMGSTTFVEVEHLVGGSADDNFKFESGGSISGDIEGNEGDDDILVVIPKDGPDQTYTIKGGAHGQVGDRLVLNAQLQSTTYDLQEQMLNIGNATIEYDNIEILEILDHHVEISSDSLQQIEQALNDLKTWAVSLQTNDELYDVIPFIDHSLANIIEPAAVIQWFVEDVIDAITEKLDEKHDPENNPNPTLTSKELVDIINNWSATIPDENNLYVDLGDITVSISQLATTKMHLLPNGPELLFDFTIGSERTSLFDLARSQVLLDYGINLDPKNTGDEMGDVTAQLRSGMEFGLELGIDNFNGSNPVYFSNQYNMVFSGHLIGQITGETSVNVLNNGQGLDINGNGPHMRILRTNGDAVDVDLSGVDNIQDILDKFNDLVSISGSGDFAMINSESTGITLSDDNGKEVLKVEALNGSQVAAQLGLLGDDYSDGTGDDTIEGKALGLLVPITDKDSDPNTLDADIGFAGGQVIDGEVALSFTTEMAFSDPSNGDEGVGGADLEQGIQSGLSQSGNVYMNLPVAISGSDFAGSGNADITGTITVGDNQSNFFATPQEVVFSSQELQNFTHVTASEAFMLLAQVAGSMQQIDNSDFFHVAIPFVQFGLTADTPLAALNKATGVGTVPGADLKIILCNGEESEVDIDDFETVGELLDKLNEIDNLSAKINHLGTGLELNDESNGTGILRVEPINDSEAALDLGLHVSGNNAARIQGGNVVPGGSLSLNDVAYFGSMMKALVASLINRDNESPTLNFHNLQGLATQLGNYLGTSVEPIYDAAAQTLAFRITTSDVNPHLVSAPVNLETEGEDSLGQLDVLTTTGVYDESPAKLDVSANMNMDILVGIDLAANIAASLGIQAFVSDVVDDEVIYVPNMVNLPENGEMSSDSRFVLMVNGVAVEVNLDQDRVDGRDQVKKDDYVLMASNLIFDPMLTKDAVFLIEIDSDQAEVSLARDITTGKAAIFGTDFTPLDANGNVLFDLGFREQQEINGTGTLELIAQELPAFSGTQGQLLGQDFNFLLTLDQGDGEGVKIYLIKLSEASTSTNNCIDDLVADLNVALENATLLTFQDGQIQVDQDNVVNLYGEVCANVEDERLTLSLNLSDQVADNNNQGLLRVDSAAAVFANRSLDDLVGDLNQSLSDAGLENRLVFVLRDAVDANGDALLDRGGNALQKLAIEVTDDTISKLRVVVNQDDGAHENLGFAGEEETITDEFGEYIQYVSESSVYEEVAEVLRQDLQQAVNDALVGVSIPNVSAAADSIIKVQRDGNRLTFRSMLDDEGYSIVESLRILAHEDSDARDADGNLQDPIFSQFGFINGAFARAQTTGIYLDQADAGVVDDLSLNLTIGGESPGDIAQVLANYGFLGLQAEGNVEVTGTIGLDFHALDDDSNGRLDLVDLLTHLDRDQFFKIASAQTSGAADAELTNVTTLDDFIDLSATTPEFTLSLGNWIPNHTLPLKVLAENPVDAGVLETGKLTANMDLQININQELTVGLFLLAEDTEDNTSLDDLLTDLNDALAETHDGIQPYDLTQSLVFETEVHGSDTYIALRSVLPPDDRYIMVESFSIATDENVTESELGFVGVKQQPVRSVEVQISGDEDLAGFTRINSSIFVNAIDRVIKDFLARSVQYEDSNGIALMQEKLPLLGIKTGDLIDFADAFKDRLSILQEQEASFANIQELRQAIIAAFENTNINGSSADISASDYHDDKQIVIDIDGFLAGGAQQSSALNINLAEMLQLLNKDDPAVRTALSGLLVEEITGSATMGETTIIQITTGTFSSDNDFYTGMLVELINTDGSAGEMRLVTDYTVSGATGTLTFSEAFSSQIESGQQFRVLKPAQNLTASGEGELIVTASGIVAMALGVDLTAEPQAYIFTDSSYTSLSWQVAAKNLEPYGQNAINPQINIGPLTVYGLNPEHLLESYGAITLTNNPATTVNLDGSSPITPVISMTGNAASTIALAFPTVNDPYESVSGLVDSSENKIIEVSGDLAEENNAYDNWIIEFTSGTHLGQRFNISSHQYNANQELHVLELDDDLNSSVNGDEFILINPLRVNIEDLESYIKDRSGLYASLNDPSVQFTSSSAAALHAPDLASLIADASPYKQIANSDNVIDALDLLFFTLQESMSDLAFLGSLPVIGEGLADLDPFVADLRVDLLNELVNLLENPASLQEVPEHLVDIERVKTAFLNAFGSLIDPTTDAFTVTASHDGGAVDIYDEASLKEADDISFQTTLHRDMSLTDIDAFFDIGDSLRSLNLLLEDAPLTLSLGFDIDLDFGFNADVGFYVNTSALNEMLVEMEFTLSDPPPGQEAYTGLLSDIPVNVKDLVRKAYGTGVTVNIGEEEITLLTTGLNVPGTTIGKVLPGESEEDSTLSGFLASVPDDGSYRLCLVDANGNEEFRDIIEVNSNEGKVTVVSAFDDDYDNAEWSIGPQASKASYRFEFNLQDNEGQDNTLSRSDMLSAASASVILEGTITSIVNLQLDVKSKRFENFLSAPQLRTDINVYWEIIDQPLLVVDADGLEYSLADQTIGIGPYAFGDSDALPSAAIENVTDSNQRITGNLQTSDKGNIINAPILIKHDGSLDSLQDGDIVRVEGVTGYHPVPVKTNGIFTISNVDREESLLYPYGGDNTFTLDGTLGEDVMWAGEFAFVGDFESLWDEGSGRVFILPKVTSVANINDTTADIELTLDRDVGFSNGDQITVNNVWAEGNNGVFTVETTDSSTVIKLRDINGNMVKGSADKAKDDYGIAAYVDSANPATITHDNVQMNLNSVVGDFLNSAMGTFREGIGEADWLLSPTKGWLFKHDPIFSFLKGRDVKVIDTVQDIALTAAATGFYRDKAIFTYLTMEVIKLLSPIYGLAERLQAEEPTGDEIWINIGGISLPDIRGVENIASLLNPQCTPIPVGVSSGAGNVLGYDTDLLKQTELEKRKSSSNDGGVDFFQNKYSFTHQTKQLTAKGISNNIDDYLGTAKKDRKTGLQSMAKSFGVSFDGSIELDFPILTKPDQALRFLLGANVDLFTLDLPAINFDLNAELSFLVCPIPPVRVNVLFGLGLGLDFAFGMDTQGYREYARSGNEDDIANGWFALDVREYQQAFLTSGEFTPQTYEADKTGLTMDDPHEITITPSVGLEVGVGLGKAVQVGLGGGIEGYVNFNWHDPDADGRIRGRELESCKWVINDEGELEENISAVWDIAGGMTWSFNLFVDLLGARVLEVDPFETAGINQTIFEAHKIFNRVPLLASDIGGDVLRLNAGPFVSDQIFGDCEDANDEFRVSLDTYNDNDRIKVEKKINGVWVTDARFYSNDPIFDPLYVQKIIGFGGEGNDTLEVSGDLGDIVVEFHGGAGNDTLTGGDGLEIFFGDDGDDTLNGSDGDDVLYGGAGNDTLEGGAGNDVLYGEQDNDILSGGAGNDHLYGDTGNDILIGGDGADIYFFAPRWGEDEVEETAIGEWDTWNFERVCESITVRFDPTGIEAFDLHGNCVTHTGSLIEKIKGGRGADQIVVSAVSGLGVDLNGRDGSDQYIINMGNGLQANIRLHDSGYRWYRDTVIINGTDGDDAIGISDQQVLLGNPVTATVFFGEDGGLETLIANMDDGDDSIYLYSTLETMSVNIYGQSGDDTVIAGNGPALVDNTLLNDLGNGGGMDINAVGAEFTIALSKGDTIEIDLDDIAKNKNKQISKLTLGDLIDYINEYQSSPQVAQLEINVDLDGLVLTDLTTGDGRLTVQVEEETNGVLNQTANLLGLVQLREESKLLVNDSPVPTETILQIASGESFKLTRQGIHSDFSVISGDTVEFMVGDVITHDGCSLTLAAGDTLLALAPGEFIDRDVQSVIPAGDGSVEITFDEDDVLMVDHADTVTLNDGINNPIVFEFTVDDHLLHEGAVKVKIDNVVEKLYAKIQDQIEDNLLDMELNLLDDGIIRISTLVGSVASPIETNNSDAFSVELTTVIEGEHIYDRRPGGDLNDIRGNEFVGPVWVHGGGEQDHDVLILDDTGDTTDNSGFLNERFISGLGMAQGVVYYQMEVIDLRLGQGNDDFLVTQTATNSISSISGGGGNDDLRASLAKRINVNPGDDLYIENDFYENISVDSELEFTAGDVITDEFGNSLTLKAGDLIKSSDGDIFVVGETGTTYVELADGGMEILSLTDPAELGTLVLYGDYPANPGILLPDGPIPADDESRDFPATGAPGDDSIDAEESLLGVIAYGGAGNDALTGSLSDDWLLGGSGDDTIEALTGDDRIWGDSAVDVDLKQYIVSAERIEGIIDPTQLVKGGSFVGVDTNGGADILGTVTDNGVPGTDTIHGDTGRDIIIGDQGLIYGVNGLFGEDNSQISNDDYAGNNDSIHGDEDDDIILAGLGNDTVEGNEGHDLILGDNGTLDYNMATGDGDLNTLDSIVTNTDNLGGTDKIHGNTGMDTIIAGQSGDEVNGDEDQDIVMGDNAAIFMRGTDGKRTVQASAITSIATNDVQDGSGGNDTLFGLESDDILIGGVGEDQIQGNDGDDLILGDNGLLNYDADGDLTGLDVIDTEENAALGGADTIAGNADADTIIGGTAGDTLYGDALESAVPAADGADIIIGDNATINLRGVTGQRYVQNDAIVDITTSDSAEDTGGADTIIGHQGDDIIMGGVNGDTVYGSAGNEVILGDNGLLDYDYDRDTGGGDNDLTTLDRIASEADATLGGVDTVHGDDGSDLIIGGTSGDILAGNAGDDILIGDNATLNLRLDTNGGRRLVQGNAIEDITTSDDLEQTGGADILHGNAGQDILIGGVNGDDIYGDGENDLILGDNGALDYDADGDLNSLDRITSQVSDKLGGVDTIEGNAGADTVIGGTAGDFIYGDAASPSNPAADADDILLGDNTFIELRATPGERELEGAAVDHLRTTDEVANTGGEDTISGDSDNDLIAGGVQGDTMRGGTGDDYILGDNGLFDWGYQGDMLQPAGISVEPVDDQDLTTLDMVTTELPAARPGGRDTVYGDDGSDVIFGGTDSDTLYGDSGDGLGEENNNDLMLGDHGVIYPQYSTHPDVHSRNFFAIDTGDADGGEGDRIFGEEGDDILLGQQGDDRMFGGSGDDDVIGGHNVSGGLDELSAPAIAATVNPAINDIMDGGTGNDALAGDNATIWRKDDITNPRFKTLSGTLMYKMFENSHPSEQDYGSADVTGQAQNDPAGAVGRDIMMLDHDAAIQAQTGARPFGDDYMAGGADNDLLFGELGDDVMQGDGLIENATGGVPITITDSGTPSTGETLYLQVREDLTDGDDYLEGNGGQELIYGNLGQDDIIGGSSNLFGSDVPNRRPDGSDEIFGGAGTAEDTARNAPGDGSHANDADMILGDNGNIYRLVSVAEDGTTAFLTFNYDEFYKETRRLISRAVDLLDYVRGVGDTDEDNVAHGGGDVIHGEAGDDSIHGMIGLDVLYGEGQDDDLFGEAANDWISGGTGDDGVLGDDGLIFTSRNDTNAEPLYGVAGFSKQDLNKYIDTPGDIQQAIINVEDLLKKSVDLVPFDRGGDDIVYGGLGNDFLHGGFGDDAVSGAEALSLSAALGEEGKLEISYVNPSNPGNILAFERFKTDEFALYDEYDPLRKILLDDDGNLSKDGTGTEFLLNFEAFTDPNDQVGTKIEDGNDVLFGDLGNDWLVGGTGQDRLYGGYGSDLLNIDDNLETNGGANDVPDSPEFSGINTTLPSDLTVGADIAYGGAGRDVLMNNTGADRLIDWVGEYNSYLVPYAPFGAFSVSRTLQPQLTEYLCDLSESDGADPSRAFDTSGDEARNGEPEGELGLVLQKDFDWQDQTGAPDDPQAGNIPGGKRDVMRAADFNEGSMEAFAPDSGIWEVRNGALQVSAESLGGDAVSVFHVDGWLPSYFEVLATVNAVKPTAGWKSNAFVIFDYQNPTDFKFAGIDVSLDKIEMGHRSADGWIVDVQSNIQAKPDTNYNMLVAIHGTNVTLVVDGEDIFSHTFAPRVDEDGFTWGLNTGMVGVGSDNSRGSFDNVTVQKLPPEITFEDTEDFTDGVADLFSGPVIGEWQITDDQRYTAVPEVDNDKAISLADLGLANGLETTSLLNLETTFNTQAMGGVIFDHYSSTDFKFVAMKADTNQIVIGHHTERGGWFFDAVADRSIEPGTDSTLSVSLKGTSVSVSLDGQVVLGHVFNSVVVDGGFGLLSAHGESSFDTVSVKTDDPAFRDEADNLMASAAPQESAGTDTTLTNSALDPIVEEAIVRLAESYTLDESQLALLDTVNFEIVDFEGLTLGYTESTIVLLDLDAAGYGWFIDTTPYDDTEFRRQNGDGELLATPSSDASGDMDLLTVVMHELGHVLGLEDLDPDTHDLMSETLDAGMRRLADDHISADSVEVNEAEDLASLVVMDASINEAEAIAPATAAAAKHGSSWLTDFLTNGAGKRYNKFDPKDDIKIEVFDDDDEEND